MGTCLALPEDINICLSLPGVRVGDQESGAKPGGRVFGPGFGALHPQIAHLHHHPEEAAQVDADFGQEDVLGPGVFGPGFGALHPQLAHLHHHPKEAAQVDADFEQEDVLGTGGFGLGFGTLHP